MFTIEIVGTVLDTLVDVVVVSIVIQALRPSVVRQDREPVAESLVNFCLQGVVVALGIVSKEVNVLRPSVLRTIWAKFVEEWSPFICQSVGKPTSVCLLIFAAGLFW